MKMIEGDNIKYLVYSKEELKNTLSKVNRPFILHNNDLLLTENILSNYNLSNKNYKKLDSKEKFLVNKIIIEYFISKNIYSRMNKLCIEKKEFNNILNKSYKSKSKKLKQEEELEKRSNTIEFNEKIIYKDIKTKDLVNDVYNNVVDNDYISLEENLENLSKSINLNIPLSIDILSNFLIYANDEKKSHKKRMSKSFDDEYLEKFLFIDYDNTSSINKCSGYKR